MPQEQENKNTSGFRAILWGASEPVVRTPRDIAVDLLLILIGVILLAIPPWFTRGMERALTIGTAGTLDLLNPDAQKTVPLELELVRLREETARLEEALRRTGEFSALAGRLRFPQGEYVPAAVIGSRFEGGRWRYLADAGVSQGVMPGAGVILGYAAFGIVEETTQNACWVLRIDAPPVKIPATIVRSRTEGLVEATTDGVILKYVKASSVGTSTEAMVDDIVIASGRAGTFPPGVIIGRVAGIGLSEDTLFHEIQIDVEANHLKGGVVIIWKGPGIQADQDAKQ